MNAYYSFYKTYYREAIKAMVNTVNIELITYDETEHFHNYNDPLFNYPFADRKSIL